MKSVRTRILLAICLVVSSSMLALGGVSIFLNNWTTRGVLEQTMTETAKVASERVSHHLMVYKTIVESAGLDSTLSSPDATAAEKQHVIDALCEKNPDFTRGNILDTQGNSIFTGQNFSDREYFAHALKGETWVSEPLVSKVTNTTSVIVAAPIWENGDPSKNVTGVVYFVPTETFMNDIVASIKLSANAGAVILNKAGTVIAHPNADFVTNQNNSQENVKTDPSMAPIAALELEMISGKTGFGTYTMGGVEKFMGFAPIPDTDGWSLSVNAPTSDFMHYTNVSIIITIILFILFIAISAVIAVRISSGIGQPLKVLADILERIASTGNIHLDDESKSQTGKYIGRHDEVGEIATAVNNLIEILMVESKELLSIADGDLTSDIAIVSPEDTLGNAMAKMAGNLNTMFRDINSASIQVSEGSRQIADGSQALAQGSTQQAAAIEQLSASISSIAAQTAQNAEMAKNAAGLSADIKDNAEKGNDQMNRMMQAVKEINDASQRISKVIAVIDSIAFQTNILALNAAVEAARAGQHGKGFAVVAEEVRNLATKSAEAASDTGALIADSMDKAQLGEKIAEETAASLREIVEGINKSTEIVEEIAHSSDEQAASIREINTGIDQVTQVVHQNSATSEESAAASQEMSSQSEVLQQLISQFKLKNS